MDPITDEEDIKYYLGRSYAQEKDYIRAIKAYKEGLAINPRSAILLYEIGLAYFKLKNKKRTLTHWKKARKVVSPHSFIGVRIKKKMKSV